MTKRHGELAVESWLLYTCANYDCGAKQFMALGLPLEGREVENAKLDVRATAGRSGLGDNVAFSTLGPRWLGTRAATVVV